MASLTVAIITKNEAANLPRWLAAVGPVADEIVAVDSGSSDATVDLLAQAGAKVCFRQWTGYADQRNHCIDQASGDWVLFLDADEFIDDELAQALNALKNGPPPAEAAFELTYKVFFSDAFCATAAIIPSAICACTAGAKPAGSPARSTSAWRPTGRWAAWPAMSTTTATGPWAIIWPGPSATAPRPPSRCWPPAAGPGR